MIPLEQEGNVATFTAEQRKELLDLAKHAPQGYVRMKALVVWNVASGRSQSEVARFMPVSRASVNSWVKCYLSQGTAGFLIKKGRGRKGKANREEIENCLRQSPRQFGLQQTRWTLRALAESVPSLKGFTDSGVYRVLVRMGYRYKRGQPHVHSPDPLYSEKRGPWERPSTKREPIPTR